MHQRLIADLACRDAGDDFTRLAQLDTVTTRQNADAQASTLQGIHHRGNDRTFARATDGQIADDHDRHRRTVAGS